MAAPLHHHLSLDALRADMRRVPPWTDAEAEDAGKRLRAARRRCRKDPERLAAIVNEYVVRNMALVWSIAARYARRGKTPLPDLVQEGAIGLRRAAEKYDPRRGYRFSTYATWWVRQAVSRAITEETIVHLPGYIFNCAASTRRASQQHAAITGEEPSAEELARITHSSVARVERSRIVAAVETPTQLDAPMLDGRASVAESFADAAPSPLDVLLSTERETQARELLEHVPERTRIVLLERFSDEPRKLSEVAEQIGVCRERVRQIQRSGLAALRKAAGKVRRGKLDAG
jgi:RNA polymerase sigma factor (sigma-70 family)